MSTSENRMKRLYDADMANSFQRIAESLELISDLLASKTQLPVTEHDIEDTADYIENTLNDPRLDVLKKHTELRKLVTRLRTAAGTGAEDDGTQSQAGFRGTISGSS